MNALSREARLVASRIVCTRKQTITTGKEVWCEPDSRGLTSHLPLYQWQCLLTALPFLGIKGDNGLSRFMHSE